jgi:DNA-binding response OmpR family regulator
MSRKHIIIIEDETDMADLVALRLKRDGYEVEVAHDGLEGWRKIRSSLPELVLLDVMLPRMSGTDLIKEMRSDPRTTGIPVIMLTAKTEESDIVVGLQLGADDYITKPFSMSVLAARVAAVFRRSGEARVAGKGVLTAGVVRIDQERHQVEVNGKPVPLTLTEFRLLVALVAGKGRVLTRDQLVDQAVGPDAIVTDRTIDVHLTGLRKKLGKARKYVETVRGLGYRLATEEHETT